MQLRNVNSVGVMLQMQVRQLCALLCEVKGTEYDGELLHAL